jgi:hypothetical protein
VTEERFQVEWVTELSRGIEWLRDGGVRVAVLDLNLPQRKSPYFAYFSQPVVAEQATRLLKSGVQEGMVH